ncbi:MAG: hypothetical protein IIY00_00690, partial [Clostridia bacterium]|nr:hypothetical protein [Clostridia bacterium]
LDESKAYTNVAYGNLGFNAKACTVADASETGITITEPGTGGIVVSFPVHLPDIATQKYKLSFDHTGNGKTRVYYKHLKADGTFGANQIAMDTTSGGHADLTISDGASLFGATQIGEWLVISVGANTGKTTTISNVSLTKSDE